MSRVEMNGCAALDIMLRQCYYANRRHRTKPLPPLYILILFCTGFGVYTKFGIEPETGAEEYMNLMSFISTARKNGFDSYHAIEMALSGRFNQIWCGGAE